MTPAHAQVKCNKVDLTNQEVQPKALLKLHNFTYRIAALPGGVTAQNKHGETAQSGECAVWPLHVFNTPQSEFRAWDLHVLLALLPLYPE